MRRLIGNVHSFYSNHRRRKDPRILLSSCLSRVTLLASRSRRRKRTRPGIALVAVRSTGKLRFPGIFIIKLRRGLFPDPLSSTSCQTLRRRHHLFCITIAQTRSRYCLSCTGDHFGCKGVRFYGPDHFLGSVSIHCLRIPRRRLVNAHVRRGTDHFQGRTDHTSCRHRPHRAKPSVFSNKPVPRRPRHFMPPHALHHVPSTDPSTTPTNPSTKKLSTNV